MKRHIYAALLLFAFHPQIRADDADELMEAAGALDAAAKTPEGERAAMNAVSDETNLLGKTLERQKAKTNFGPGELFIANSLASATGKSFDEIVAIRATGKGWGEIAKDSNLSLGRTISKARHAAEKASTEIGTTKADKVKPMGKADDKEEEDSEVKPNSEDDNDVDEADGGKGAEQGRRAPGEAGKSKPAGGGNSGKAKHSGGKPSGPKPAKAAGSRAK